MAERWRVAVADTTVAAAEIDAVSRVLSARWLSAGETTRAFEREFARALGVPDAVAVSSGTAALHLAVLALDIGPGDEVVMPSLSFVAAAEVTALLGAVPVFADVRSEQDLTIDPDDVSRLLTSRTRAVVAMHYSGFPADLARLRALTDEHGLALIEDAAHAPVVRAGSRMAGTVGDLGCFSFHPAKNITTGEGGMVVGTDADRLDRVRAMRSHCVARTGGIGYDVTGVGLNYRPTEVSSALGRVQLGRLAEDRARRGAVRATYEEMLRDVPGVVVPFAEHTGDSAHHLFAVLVPARLRDELCRRLAAEGIQTTMHYPPTHRFSFYRTAYPGAHRPLPVTERVAARLVSLPMHARMSTGDAAFVARAVRSVLDPRAAHRPRRVPG
ncbi:DegT/DnrJ/EryC1/StrS aminotransferase family protein [Plantactinospora sp. KLBMP9567]|uniref:DegT/DnrJ/EryC1/StrS family aminotransferase n=1 Tax=Plantactinospora sp. KLBMP9567 TaxID=3085900 RepID=UPI0029816D82|nr:DegT/DnrJ/EryC1/StrS aminotransferase family protein [Plantactinospora sp. KLBMP9567]MDW5329541.1 DegT/DnrJ/EryC1/StrS aminotransferase family protein [Plantactinospora sp. KLBMP9567]